MYNLFCNIVLKQTFSEHSDINVVCVSEILCNGLIFSELRQLLSCCVKIYFLSSTLMYLLNPVDCLTCTVYRGEKVVQVWLKE